MYQLLGLKPNLATVRYLSRRHVMKQNRNSQGRALKIAYKKFLSEIQPTVPQTSTIGVNFVEDRRLLNRFIDDFFRVDTPLNDLNQTKVIHSSGRHFRAHQKRTLRRVEHVLNKMRVICPEFEKLVNMVVNSIFYAPSKVASGGTSSAAVGVIWVNKLSQGEQDVLELLVHESTHTLMFLDELRYGHYWDYRLIPQKRNWVKSAVQGVKRPLDKVIHSLVVATEVLLFRERCFGHPQKPNVHPLSSEMIQSCLETIQALRGISQHKKILTKRSFFLIDNCERAIHAHLLKAPKMAGG